MSLSFRGDYFYYIFRYSAFFLPRGSRAQPASVRPSQPPAACPASGSFRNRPERLRPRGQSPPRQHPRRHVPAAPCHRPPACSLHVPPATLGTPPRLCGVAASPCVSGSPSRFLDPLGRAGSVVLFQTPHKHQAACFFSLGRPGARVPIETTAPRRVTGEGGKQGRPHLGQPGPLRAGEGARLPFPFLLFT